MTLILKNKLKDTGLDHQCVSREKVRRFMRKFVGVSFKKNVKVPIKKTSKAHHRLRNTWIL